MWQIIMWFDKHWPGCSCTGHGSTVDLTVCLSICHLSTHLSVCLCFQFLSCIFRFKCFINVRGKFFLIVMFIIWGQIASWTCTICISLIHFIVLLQECILLVLELVTLISNWDSFLLGLNFGTCYRCLVFIECSWF